jgi:hypothetical protein
LNTLSASTTPPRASIASPFPCASLAHRIFPRAISPICHEKSARV